MYFNLTNDDIVFSLLDSQYNFNFLIGAVVKMIISKWCGSMTLFK